MATVPTTATIIMDDGRSVEFQGKKRLIKTTTITDDGKIVTRLDYKNGESRTFTLPDNLVLRCAAHGIDQKLGDELAGIPDLDDGVIAIDELIERLKTGEWAVKRDSAGAAGSSILQKAIMEHTGKSGNEIKAFLAGKTMAQKMALRNNPKVAPIVARLEAEKVRKPVENPIDTDALLDEIN